MRKILILSDLFPPAFGPRMGYLAKYLRTNGWTPVVIAEHIEDDTFAFLTNGCEIHSIKFNNTSRFRKLKWLSVFLGEVFFNYKNRKIYNAAMALTQKHSFDLILCSTFRSFPLAAAQKIARDTQLPLVVDVRDIIEQFAGYEFIARSLPDIPVVKQLVASLFKHSSLRERNKALRSADHVVTVSPWHVDVLKKHNPNTSLIYNGYDPELFFPAPNPSEQFIISYTGRLLSLSMRNPDLLLKAMRKLADDAVLSASECRIEWYVDEASEMILREESAKYDVLDFMDFKGYIPATEIPEVLNKSSILLLLTNKSDKDGPKGIMTTKFFEFLAVEKPILCVRSDEEHLEKAIKETNSGLAARSEEEVYAFIKQQYRLWKKNGFTKADTIREKAIAFSRKEQATQFIRIFEQALNKHNG